MFRKNSKHQQPALISAASELPEKQRKRLENSWAGAFYKEFFSRIDEQSFAVLYSEKDSRPNVPVNVLVGLEALKAGFGWSDQELYENYCYDLQVRYALGYDRLGDGDPSTGSGQALRSARCTTFESASANTMQRKESTLRQAQGRLCWKKRLRKSRMPRSWI